MDLQETILEKEATSFAIKEGISVELAILCWQACADYLMLKDKVYTDSKEWIDFVPPEK